ncbi:chloroplastic group IIA intron splicing facilitator CRS1, chloroplastic [Panicum miliaceum]|uniref:CRM-domain containing factor CFM3, chloroplastic/mitochondrial n=1 Tax=Panicum miliaceum TaxID=4540 RepID=A0A3L6PS59_PANMI|nr:chloroplastic group IIA intron splicing facilitator CRS1, chloroplastic [Panicum miliaceum]
MLLTFSPHPSPLLLSLPATSASKPRARLRPVHASASASPSPELLGKSALRRISDKLRSLGYLETGSETPAPAPDTSGDAPSAGEIFVPTPAQLPRHRVGSTLDPSWATADGEAGSAARRQRKGRGRDAASAPPSAAELALPRDELRRLQGIGIKVRKRLKVGKAGITEGIVNGIHERWRNAEVVKIRFEDVWAMNMRRTHEMLERKTGGLVIWRSGSTIILYRGTDYKYPYFHHRERMDGLLDEESSEQSSSEDEDEHLGTGSVALSSSGEEDETTFQHDSSYESSENPVIACAEQRSAGEGKNHTIGDLSQSLSREKYTTRPILSTKRLVFGTHEGNLDTRTGAPNQQHTRLHVNTHADHRGNIGPGDRSSLVAGVGSPNKFRLQLPGEVKLAEEADKLLDGLGPRFSGWWGYDPLPVDADLLPAIVPGYRRPFRLLPSGVPPKLTDREMTILRRLAHPLPFHYALGRSSNLQGLAASMIKLWERCEVAKIAIKRDANNTDSELITEELKGLTGGTLLSRDKESIVFYRGKDFLPPAVSLAIEKRRKLGGSTIYKPKPDTEESTPAQDASVLKVSSDVPVHIHEEEMSVPESRSQSLNAVAQSVETRLSQAIAEKERAERLLEELENASQPSKAETREDISEEERYMLRKVGLKMKQFLLLGRRGVFDGTIENMHLHWKYRELVKIICKEHSLKDVEYAARTLEAESGGILVAVEKVSKGHAIIVYRGKNYQRPSTLRPKTLLSKKDALKRSMENQRCKSLKVHVLNLSKNIDYLRDQMNSSYYKTTIHGPSVNSGTLQQKNEEVPEDAPKSSEPEVEECASVVMDRTLNLTKSRVPLDDDDMQSKVCLTKLEDDSSLTASPCLTRRSSAVSFNDLNRHQNEHSSTVTFDPDSHSEGDSKDVDAPKFDVESDPLLPLRATPLSNKERLVLRKQALKMKKRPVLSIGRNNVITGVAKTIKTHFKKHPLAIVNIKNRADGTPIQQLITELEEATGSVLVSQETNKVILYRGWGAEVAQKSSKENGTDEEKEVISPQLLEAIRLECGLLPGESQDSWTPE